MSYPTSFQTTSLSFDKETLLLYIKALLAILSASTGQTLVFLIPVIVAAHSARILTSRTKVQPDIMDNDPQPVQEQKKEKSLNQYERPFLFGSATNLSRLLTSSIVDIYVGPESTHWPLHERLVCYHSPFLANIFYKEDNSKNEDGSRKSSGRKSYGFPDEEDHTFTLLVGWLYGGTVPQPKSEKDVGPLLDLYLLAQTLQIDRLSTDVVDATREFYHSSNSYPGLRRVQYIYAETDEDNEMREMMVSSVARQLATTQKIPAHWVTALQRNGQLAVDIIRSIQKWAIEEANIPDSRNRSVSSGRGRWDKLGFSAIARDADSMETDTTAVTGSVSMGSNMGVESMTSQATSVADDKNSNRADSTARSTSEAGQEVSVEA